jgi:hypothetical protein
MYAVSSFVFNKNCYINNRAIYIQFAPDPVIHYCYRYIENILTDAVKVVHFSYPNSYQFEKFSDYEISIVKSASGLILNKLLITAYFHMSHMNIILYNSCRSTDSCFS